MEFKELPKLKPGDKVAILSPSFAAPGKWPHVYELGLKRVREVFNLEPVEFPTTKKIGASKEERSTDLVSAFEDKSIKAVISTLGGDDQVTYVKNLPSKPFADNPKPFFGYSDNTHFMNHLWLNGVPSYYGGALFTQFAMQQTMDEFTVNYLKHALFGKELVKLGSSDTYKDIGLNWDDPTTLNQERIKESNEGWVWNGTANIDGVTWGGCLESIDEILRHSINIPSLKEFENIVLFTETSEEIPDSDYVARVYRALGELGILERAKGILVGRPKAWDFGKEKTPEEKAIYKRKQQDAIITTVRNYNTSIPIIQNIDFGHTDPQICLPMGSYVKIDASDKLIEVQF